MQTLPKYQCEQCHKHFRYSLWSAAFGDCSYAYCDLCGVLAIVHYNHPRMALMPPSTKLHQEIDMHWEPCLKSCACGGSFRHGASPRCPHCRQPLPADLAGVQFQQNARNMGRGWTWQGNWSDEFCIAIEDPDNPGSLLQDDDAISGNSAISALHKGSISIVDR